MTSVYEPWDEARGAEIIAEHDKLDRTFVTISIAPHCRETRGVKPLICPTC